MSTIIIPVTFDKRYFQISVRFVVSKTSVPELSTFKGRPMVFETKIPWVSTHKTSSNGRYFLLPYLLLIQDLQIRRVTVRS